MAASLEENLILGEREIQQKCRRIAYEILENNYDENELIIAGIFDQGYVFAGMLSKQLKEICKKKITLLKITLDKSAPLQGDIVLSETMEAVEGKTVVLVDDVLNTGRTLAYSLKPFLGVRIKKLETAVLINRSHKSFPISATYTGYELSTTINEHIEVKLESSQFGVYLV